MIPFLAAWILAAAPALPVAPAEVAWRTRIRKFAVEHFKQPAWGYSHSARDYRLARSLAVTDHVVLDDDVLFAAAYLHDIAAFDPWSRADVDHADQAASIVGPMLIDAGFPAAKIPAVQGAIRTHIYARDPRSPEALYLHDADALDWLGAIGVARIIALVDPKGGDPDGPGAVRTLERNLADVPARVLSPAGKALLPARRAELTAYLAALRAETEGVTEL